MRNGGFLVDRRKLVRSIKRKTRKHYPAEQKVRIALAGLRGEECIAALGSVRLSVYV